MKHIKLFENNFDIASYKRTDGGHRNFFAAKKLAPPSKQNLEKREAAMVKVKENIRDTIKEIENMPVTDWYEENISYLNTLYGILDQLEGTGEFSKE